MAAWLQNAKIELMPILRAMRIRKVPDRIS